jgi:hypothetical protein
MTTPTNHHLTATDQHGKQIRGKVSTIQTLVQTEIQAAALALHQFGRMPFDLEPVLSGGSCLGAGL